MTSTGGDTNISDEAVKEATGRDWAAWFDVLDAWDAAEKGHQATAAWLQEEHDVEGWWAQMVTVQYERTRGLRAVGQRSGGAWGVSAQRTLDVEPAALWAVLSTGDWLEGVSRVRLTEGRGFELDDGTEIEVRRVVEGERVRLAWSEPGWERASYLEVTLEERGGGRVTVRFSHDQLPSEKQREEKRDLWQRVLAGLARRTDS